MQTNPIYYFYKPVALGPDGTAGEPGDKFYQCCHGGKKVLKITKKMRNNLNGKSGMHFSHVMSPLTTVRLIGLIGNLKACAPDMFNFFGYLKDRPSNLPIMQEEKDIASGIKMLTTSK